MNRNTGDLLARCLDSLKNQMGHVTMDVVVVDNGSIDGSVQMLAECYPWVEVREEMENRGYSAAINAGVSGTMSPYLLIMNSDVELEADAVLELVTFMELNPGTAVAGPALLNPDGSTQRSFNRLFPGMGSVLSYASGVASLKEKLYRVKSVREACARIFWRSRRPRKVSWVGGACFMIRSDAFEELGGMDEAFFLYCEDTDLCRRARKAGKMVCFVPRARAVHHWNMSIGKLPVAGYFASLRSTLRYHHKHHPASRAVIRFLIGMGIIARLAAVAVLRSFLSRFPGMGERFLLLPWRYWEGLEIVTGRPVRQPLKQAALKLLFPVRNFLLRLLIPFPYRLDGSRGLTDVRKILILRTDGLGDMVLTLPFFRMMKAAYPHALIFVLAGRSGQELLRTDHNVYQVLKLPDGGLVKRSRAAFRLRAEGFDLVIDPFITDSIETALSAWFAGGRYRAGFSSPGRNRFFNIRTPSGDLGRSMLENYRNLAESVGCRETRCDDRLSGGIVVTDRERRWAGERLCRLGISPGDPILGIHPGGRYESQRWPIERYLAVAREIVENPAPRFHLRVVLLGGSEWKSAERLVATLPEGIVLLEDTGLDRFAALLERITLLLCNNSGPLHAARALGVPTISLAGPTRSAFLPRDEEDHSVVEVELGCRPCDKPLCAHHRCLRSISVGRVVTLVRDRMSLPAKKVQRQTEYGLDRTNG